MEPFICYHQACRQGKFATEYRKKSKKRKKKIILKRKINLSALKQHFFPVCKTMGNSMLTWTSYKCSTSSKHFLAWSILRKLIFPTIHFPYELNFLFIYFIFVEVVDWGGYWLSCLDCHFATIYMLKTNMWIPQTYNVICVRSRSWSTGNYCWIVELLLNPSSQSMRTCG